MSYKTFSFCNGAFEVTTIDDLTILVSVAPVIPDDELIRYLDTGLLSSPPSNLIFGLIMVRAYREIVRTKPAAA